MEKVKYCLSLANLRRQFSIWREAGERLSRGGREKAANMIEVIDVNAKTTKRTIVLDVIYALEVELLHLLPIQQVNQRYLKPVHH